MQKTRLVNLHWGDMTDSSSLIRIIQLYSPMKSIIWLLRAM